MAQFIVPGLFLAIFSLAVHAGPLQEGFALWPSSGEATGRGNTWAAVKGNTSDNPAARHADKAGLELSPQWAESRFQPGSAAGYFPLGAGGLRVRVFGHDSGNQTSGLGFGPYSMRGVTLETAVPVNFSEARIRYEALDLQYGWEARPGFALGLGLRVHSGKVSNEISLNDYLFCGFGGCLVPPWPPGFIGCFPRGAGCLLAPRQIRSETDEKGYEITLGAQQVLRQDLTIGATISYLRNQFDWLNTATSLEFGTRWHFLTESSRESAIHARLGAQYEATPGTHLALDFDTRGSQFFFGVEQKLSNHLKLAAGYTSGGQTLGATYAEKHWGFALAYAKDQDRERARDFSFPSSDLITATLRIRF